MTDMSLARAQIRNALIFSALFLGLSAALRWLAPEYLTDELRQRLLGVAMGALTIYFGNMAAKTLTPLARLRCNPVTEQAIRRFSAWAITLGGVAYTIAFIVAPIAIADVIATAFLGCAVLLVIARLTWAKTKRLRA